MRRGLLVLALSTFGCRLAPSTQPFEPTPGVGGGTAMAAEPPDDDPSPADPGGRSATPSAASPDSTAGSAPPSPATGGEAGADATFSAGGGASDSAPTPAPAPAASSGTAVCGAQSVTLDEIRNGEVRSSVPVSLGAVAVSQKFLLSHAHSGSCLFGAFLGADPAADGPRGVLVVSYGADAAEAEPCLPGHDAIPDDLVPGDAVSATGFVSSYAPSSCSGVVGSPQLLVDGGCSLVRTGRRVLPAPYVLSLAEATALAGGTDASLVRRFANGLVELSGLTTLRPDEGTGSVGPYGVVRFAETTLELHNDLEYGDLSQGGPGASEKSLVVPYPAAFVAVTGLVYLDYCTWALTPRSRCSDLDPPSGNCP